MKEKICTLKKYSYHHIKEKKRLARLVNEGENMYLFISIYQREEEIGKVHKGRRVEIASVP